MSERSPGDGPVRSAPMRRFGRRKATSAQSVESDTADTEGTVGDKTATESAATDSAATDSAATESPTGDVTKSGAEGSGAEGSGAEGSGAEGLGAEGSSAADTEAAEGSSDEWVSAAGTSSGDVVADVDGGSGTAVSDAAVSDAAVSDPAVSDTADSDNSVAPDPEDLERGLTYRERRRRRESGSSAAAAATGEGKVRYRGARRGGAKKFAAIAACSIVIIACLVATAVFAIGIGRDEHKQDLRAQYSTFARQMVVDLTTLNADNVDDAMKTLEDKTSGRAHQQMQNSMKQATSLVRDQKLDTKSTVLSDAVTHATDDEGTVILVYGWQMKPENPKEEMIVQTFRWRVQITRINDDLKMTDFEWVT
ncbi:hypothetical protein AAFP35_15475 [Gordonia sp. CPCC 206044]|uniref:hypothetical protein n=1 Tax=Gordonia sp. CPCC 206044 TaxID=3140793 RepID=UPI003AF34616